MIFFSFQIDSGLDCALENSIFIEWWNNVIKYQKAVARLMFLVLKNHCKVACSKINTRNMKHKSRSNSACTLKQSWKLKMNWIFINYNHIWLFNNMLVNTQNCCFFSLMHSENQLQCLTCISLDESKYSQFLYLSSN